MPKTYRVTVHDDFLEVQNLETIGKLNAPEFDIAAYVVELFLRTNGGSATKDVTITGTGFEVVDVVQ